MAGEKKVISDFVVFTSKSKPTQLGDGDFDTLGRCFSGVWSASFIALGVSKFRVKAMASQKGIQQERKAFCIED